MVYDVSLGLSPDMCFLYYQNACMQFFHSLAAIPRANISLLGGYHQWMSDSAGRISPVDIPDCDISLACLLIILR